MVRMIAGDERGLLKLNDANPLAISHEPAVEKRHLKVSRGHRGLVH